MDLHGDPELWALVGTRVAAAAFVDGKFRRDLTTSAQWRELLGEAVVPLPGWVLPVIDAHVHVIAGGLPALERIDTTLGLHGLVLMPLPEGTHYAGLDAANDVAILGGRTLPAEVVVFAMLSPDAADPLADLERAVDAGARGVKLISGHGSYFVASGSQPLDGPKMRRVFAYCETHGLPIIWHVNSHLYAQGFLRVLADYPRLTVINPHFGGYLTYAPVMMRHLLERYPNLSFDISLGTQTRYVRRALEDVSFAHDAWRKLIIDHPDRFLYGTDMVVGPQSAVSHAIMLERLYTSWLTDERFDVDLFPPQGYGELEDEGVHVVGLRGLALPPAILAQVLAKNAERLLFIAKAPSAAP